MAYKTLQPERLYERIVAQIETQIFSAQLKLGDQLSPERDLAEQFGVSRTAIREAIKTLRQKGLVAVEHGRGTFISNRTPQAMRHSLGLMMKIGPVYRSRSKFSSRARGGDAKSIYSHFD
ncbi:MAG: FadR family transcriptional regulator [Chloroflexi bacterium]|nr:FadR family transcriptional regulator [Chloroflexota bacterium]